MSFESSRKCQVGKNTLKGERAILLNTMYSLNQRLLCGAVYSIEREHESRNEGVEEVSPFTITLSDPLGDFVLSVSATQGEHILAGRHSKYPKEL